MPAHHHTWTDLPTDHPMDLIDRKRIYAERMMVAQVILHKGFKVPTHHHENEQIALCTSGRVRFVIDEGAPNEHTLILEGGQVLHLPSNVPHSAEALDESVIYDLFSPPAQSTGVDR